MFYCHGCAEKNNWPESFSQSRGPCEMCGKMSLCNDVPSSQSPGRPVKNQKNREVKS